MTYNLCYFLGNKAFVIDFLETGLLCCVCLRLTGERFVWGEYIPPTRIPTLTLSGVFAVIRQQ